MQKFVISEKKNLKIMLKIKKIVKLGTIVIKYRGAAHSICNLKHNVPKSIL